MRLMLLVYMEIILTDENKIWNAHNVLALVILQTFTTGKLIYKGKIYLNSLIVNLSWISISQDQKVTTTLFTSV